LLVADLSKTKNYCNQTEISETRFKLPMRVFQFLLARSRRSLAMAIGFGLLSGAFNSGLLALANAAISHPGRRSSSILYAFIGLCVLAPATRMISEVLLVRVGQNAVFRLRTELARQVLAVPLRRLEEIGSHRVLSVLTDDVPNLANVVAIIPLLCINIGIVAGCLFYMGWLAPKLLADVMAVMVIGVLSYQFGVSRAAQYLKRAREHDNHLMKHFRGLVHGIKELKLHQRRRNAFLSDLLDQTAKECRAANVSGLTVYSIASSWGQLLVFVTIGLLMFLLTRSQGAGTGVLSGFSLALLYMMTPLQVIMNSLPALVRANIAIGNAQGIGLMLTAPNVEQEPAFSAGSTGFVAQLELSDVTYSYRHEDSADQFVLGPIDLSVVAGELLFITGGNGSGKTTLAKLIVGLYAPDSGDIRYNGELVKDSNRENYRQIFSVVFSDPFLFESLLGLDGSQLDERAQEYLLRLRLEHKVTIKNGALSTTELSQGQRKRLALLTCYLEDRPIYFFDEWAADQDPRFKEVFYFSVLPGLRACGKTVIVISHDDRYYSVADRVITLEAGRRCEPALSQVGTA
jgi:putative ATP-binding cassette transporter